MSVQTVSIDLSAVAIHAQEDVEFPRIAQGEGGERSHQALVPEMRKNVTGELVDRMAGASSASKATETTDVGDQETLSGL